MGENSIAREKYIGNKDLESRDFGHNITMIMTFMRHEQPGKTPEGLSADFLTEEGELSATKRGGERKIENLKIYSSPKFRAQRTVNLVAENVDETINVINKTFTETTNVNPKNEASKNKFIVREVKELDAIKNMGPLYLEGMRHADTLIAQGDKHSQLDLAVQYVLDNPERSKELNSLTPEEIASEMAHRITYETQMSNKFYNNSKVELLHGTHGPRFEPFLQQVIVNDDGTHGFKHLDEIGGAAKPGEGFSIIQKRSTKDEINNDNYSLELTYKNKTYQVDLIRLKELAVLYKKEVKNKIFNK